MVNLDYYFGRIAPKAKKRRASPKAKATPLSGGCVLLTPTRWKKATELHCTKPNSI